MPLPPRSLELNPAENTRQFMRDTWLSNRIFSSHQDIVHHGCFLRGIRALGAFKELARKAVPFAVRGCRISGDVPSEWRKLSVGRFGADKGGAYVSSSEDQGREPKRQHGEIGERDQQGEAEQEEWQDVSQGRLERYPAHLARPIEAEADGRPLGIGSGSLAILAGLPEDECEDILAFQAEARRPFGIDDASLRDSIRSTRDRGSCWSAAASICRRPTMPCRP